MWSQDLPSKSVAHLPPIVPERVYYEFDEPLIFAAHLGLSELLFTKIDQVPSGSLFLAAAVQGRILDALGDNLLSVRGAIESGACFVVEIGGGGRVSRYWDVAFEDVPEDYLPVRGVGLDPAVEWVADAFDQIDAFFSVRFSGEELSKESMSFQTFKSLVDSFYDSVRHMFVPPGLEKAKSATFDFKIHEPAFGSLILTIDRPQLHPGNIRRHLRRPDLEMTQVQEGFALRKDHCGVDQ